MSHYCFPKLLSQLIGHSFRVLDRIVKQCGTKHLCISYSTFIAQHVGGGNRMIDIWRSIYILASLVTMFVSSEGKRFKNDTYVLC